MRRIVCVFAATLLPLLTAAQIPDERVTALDGFISPFEAFAMFDGTILVDIGGEVVYRRSFGSANHEHRVSHGSDTRFRIASLSKAMTDAAIARLIHENALSTSTALSSLLPDFPRAADITIRQLLDHSSGIPHTNDQAWGEGDQSLPHDEIVRRLAALPLDFEPGSDSNYSNGGYAVLAKILAILRGGSYDAAMRQLVFEPLQMNDTGHIADSRAVVPGLATGYEPGLVPGDRRRARFYAVEMRPGGGSLYSTVDDVLRFARAIFRDDFVPPDLRRNIMGLDDDGYLSQGRSPGFVAKLFVDPERDVIVVSLGNNYAVPAGWSAAIADVATGAVSGNPWPDVVGAAATVRESDPRLGRFRNSFGGFEIEHRRTAAGHLLSWDDVSRQYAALIPLQDGDYLQPLYFQKCAQDSHSRIITCRMLSGDDRYTSTLTPVPD